MLHILRSAAFVALLSLPIACAPRKAIQVGHIPPAQAPSGDELQVAEQFVSGHISKEGYRPISSGAQLARVQKVTNKLFVAGGFKPSDFKVHLVDAGDEVNAMAVNSASIVVYKKLLDKVKNDDELAVILSHEIGHILGRHSQDNGKEKRASIVSVGSNILGVAASVATSYAGLGGASNLAGDLVSGTGELVGYAALVGKFDRDQEYEADHVGLMLMAKAGYNPEAAVGLWARAEEVFGSKNSTMSSFFSTHPAADDRAEALKEALPISMAMYREKSKK